MDDIPEGFAALERRSPFVEPMGPFFRKVDGRTLILGVRIEPRHTNARGLVHGGLIATMADLALGYSLALAESPPENAVTASLTTDLFGGAEIGAWLEVRAVAKRVGGSLAFCAGEVLTDGVPIAQATGVYKVSRRPKPR
jgi:acyl-coenzyme A thioesterase 13